MLALRRQLRSGRVLIARSVLSAVARQCEGGSRGSLAAVGGGGRL